MTSIPWYCINLDHAVERRDKVENEFAKAGIDYTLHKGIYGKRLISTELKLHTNQMSRLLGHLGTIGCAMSHVSVWELANEIDLPVVGVTEDDVCFTENAKSQMDTYLGELQQTGIQWDIIYFGHREFMPDRPLGIGWNIYRLFHKIGNTKQTQVSQHWYIPRIAFGLHCYVLSQSGYRKLIAAIKHNIAGHLDLQIQGLSHIKSLAAWPPLAYQSPTNSSSSFTDTTFPQCLTYWLDTPKEHSFSMAYIMGCPVGQIFGQNINYWVAVCIVCGVVLSTVGVHWSLICIGFLYFLLINAMFSLAIGISTNDSWHRSCFTGLVLLTPTILSLLTKKFEALSRSTK